MRFIAASVSSIGAAAVARHAFGVREIKHRLAAAGEPHALMAAVEKAVAPESRVQRLVAFVLGDEHDERRQVLVHRAQAVADPRADRRAAGDLRAGLKERDRGVVVDGLGVHALDEAQLVGQRGGVRHQLAHPRAAFAVLLELERTAGERDRGLVDAHAGEPLAAADVVGQLFAVLFVQQRLVVEQVLLRRPAALEEIDDALGSRGVVEFIEDAGERVLWCRGSWCRFIGQKRRQAETAEAERGGAGEEVAASEGYRRTMNDER